MVAPGPTLLMVKTALRNHEFAVDPPA